jgi:hypothetical protein
LKTRELSARYIDSDSWKTVVQINAGEERKHSFSVSEEESVTLEVSSQQALKSSLGLTEASMAGLKSAIESTITFSSKDMRARKHVVSQSMDRTFKLPDPADATSLFVQARVIQTAPIYRKMVATLRVQCKACKVQQLLPALVLQQLPRVATRHEDHMSDGTVRLVETGDLTL